MEHNIGDIINGTISGVKPYGVFVKFKDTFGFCHISNCSYKFIKNLNESFPIGMEIKAKIVEIDLENNRINLSIKDCENQSLYSKQKPKVHKPKIEKPKQEFKNPVQFEIKESVKTSFEDMLKSYLKSSDEKLDAIGKINRKHTKR